MSDGNYIEGVQRFGFTRGDELLSVLNLMIEMYSSDMPPKIKKKLEKLMELELKGLKSSIESNNLLENYRLEGGKSALEQSKVNQNTKNQRTRNIKVIKFKGNKPGDKDDSSDS